MEPPARGEQPAARAAGGGPPGCAASGSSPAPGPGARAEREAAGAGPRRGRGGGAGGGGKERERVCYGALLYNEARRAQGRGPACRGYSTERHKFEPLSPDDQTRVLKELRNVSKFQYFCFGASQYKPDAPHHDFGPTKPSMPLCGGMEVIVAEELPAGKEAREGGGRAAEGSGWAKPEGRGGGREQPAASYSSRPKSSMPYGSPAPPKGPDAPGRAWTDEIQPFAEKFARSAAKITRKMGRNLDKAISTIQTSFERITDEFRRS